MQKVLVSIMIVLSSLFAFASKPAEVRMPPVNFVVFHKPGPAWVAGVDFRQQPGVQAHVAHYAKLYEEGRLELGGPFLDNSGGMMVAAQGETLESITKFAEEDPAVRSGLLVFEVKPWMIVMSKDR
jgi:adhesin HecA-like repeat protein